MDKDTERKLRYTLDRIESENAFIQWENLNKTKDRKPSPEIKTTADKIIAVLSFLAVGLAAAWLLGLFD